MSTQSEALTVRIWRCIQQAVTAARCLVVAASGASVASPGCRASGVALRVLVSVDIDVRLCDTPMSAALTPLSRFANDLQCFTARP